MPKTFWCEVPKLPTHDHNCKEGDDDQDPPGQVPSPQHDSAWRCVGEKFVWKQRKFCILVLQRKDVPVNPVSELHLKNYILSALQNGDIDSLSEMSYGDLN